MNNASETLYALRPVTFRYKKEIDPAGMLSFGLIAEEVEAINPDLITCDEHGKPQTVRYEAVNAMLLNEFLKEHLKVEGQQAAISELKALVQQQKNEFQAAIAEQRQEFEARLNEQNARIQKIDAQVELRKTSLRTLADNP